jgi:hypothetical protein
MPIPLLNMTYTSLGYFHQPNLCSADEIASLSSAVTEHYRTSTRLALRNPTVLSVGLALRQRIPPLIADIADIADAQVISCHYFTKDDTQNWSVPFHRDDFFMSELIRSEQDMSEKCDKEGVPFARLSLRLLRKIVAVRIALDDIKKIMGRC